MLLLNEAVETARMYCQDAVTPYRFSNEKLVNQFNSALRRCIELRPDLFVYPYSRSIEGMPFSALDVEDSNGNPVETEVDIPSQLLTPLALFMAAHLEMSDDEFTAESKSMGFLKEFKLMLLGA